MRWFIFSLMLLLSGCFASWTDDGATIEPMINTNVCFLALCFLSAEDKTESEEETITTMDEEQ